MSALNPIIFTLKNPSQRSKPKRETRLSETPESIVEIPAYLLQRAIQTCETKTEIVIFMVVARFSLGFNRDKCILSRRFIAEWTGLQFQNVGRGIEGLISKGLIEKLPESNVKQGDCFKILHVQLSEKPSLTRNQNDYSKSPERNQVENTQGVITLITERTQSDDEASSKRLRSVITSITKNKIEELKESSIFSERLKAHLQSLPMAHMRKIEKTNLEALLSQHSCADVELALDYVRKHGTVGDKASCKLPLAYLAKSISRVLELAREEHAEQTRKVELATLAQRKAELEQKQKLAVERETTEALEAFEAAYPDKNSQEEVLSKILQDNFRMMSGNGPTGRRLALRYWFTKIHKGLA